MISKEYKELNRKLHETDPAYGVSGHKFKGRVLQMCAMLESDDILDYGCGKSTLAQSLGKKIQCYDPCIPEHSTPPKPADILVCTDVMEHVEPEYVDDVLADIARLMLKIGLITIACRPAMKVLEDGRNAHLIQEDFRWWFPRVWKHMDIVQFDNVWNKEYLVFVAPRDRDWSQYLRKD